MAASFKTLLIAPCGMNCGICYAYLRVKNKCHGCRGDDIYKSPSCLKCKILNCVNFASGKAKFCFTCAEFPCAAVKHLDKRYRTRYNMSMIENLENIKHAGIKKFLMSEKERWTCAQCGGTINVHRGTVPLAVKQSISMKIQTGPGLSEAEKNDRIENVPRLIRTEICPPLPKMPGFAILASCH